PWLARLEKFQPNTPQTQELKARLLNAQGKSEEATALLRAHSAKGTLSVRRTATLLEELGQVRAAEEFYRLSANEAGQPGARLVLAGFLARQKRLEEALTVCEEARKIAHAESVAAAGVAALYAAESEAVQIDRVRGWIEDGLRRTPQSQALLASLAALHNLQGNYAKAIELYRQLVTRNAADALVLNNLAWLLAVVEGKGAEALELLRLAEGRGGPPPGLLGHRRVGYSGPRRPQ